MFVPAIAIGRLKTVLRELLNPGAAKAARDNAWAIYKPLCERLNLRMAMKPANRLGRFARHIQEIPRTGPVRYLEIGAFEGSSLAFVHELLKGQVQTTAIDPFLDNPEYPTDNWNSVRATFDKNVAASGAQDKTRVLVGRSIDHLPKLIDDKEQFDLIYIDGSHATLDVMVDAALAWPLLAPGGLMIFDDYWHQADNLGLSYRPKPAVDGFVGAIALEVTVVDVGGQVFLRKR